MSDDRRGLAAAVLTAGGRINGTALAVSGYAELLRQAGATDGDLILLTGLSPDAFLAAAVACWSRGAVPWLSPRTFDGPPPDEASFIVSGGNGVIRGKGTAGPVTAPVAVVHETSGSTGEPKSAQRSVDSVHTEHRGYRLGLGLTPADTVRVPLPVAHSLGWGVAVSGLLSGCDVDVRPFATPSRVAADLDQGSATVVALTPSLARLLAGTSRRADSSPRAALVGAGEVSADLDAAFERRFGPAITRGYGSTETGGIFIGPTGMGQPIASVEIVAPSIGARGELVVRTRTPLAGYLGDGLRESRHWHMRDVVERDASGQAWFVARAPGPVRANGRVVAVHDVHAALAALDGVEEVVFVVVPRAGRPEFEDVFAVVTGRGVEHRPVEDTIRAAGGRGLALRVRIVDRLPRTDMGKLDRQALTDWIGRDG